MSQENVEVVRAVLEAWNARREDAVRDLYDPHAAIMRFIEGWPESEPVVGRDAVMAFFEAMRQWDDDTAEPIGDFIHSGNTVAVRLRWRTSAQGQEVGMELTAVYTLRSQKVSVVEFFRDHAEALEAVGLSE